MAAPTQTAPGRVKLPLWPFKGFKNSVPRQEVPIDQMTGPSHDWLVVRGRLRRRAGSTTVTNGLLESKWGARARRMVAASLKCVTDSFPTPLLLLTNETINAATLAFRKAQGGPWHQVGDDFSPATYPDTGVVTHRVVPMVYENEYDGLTLHRLNTAEYRAHMAAGSRDVLQVGGQVCWGGYRSAPTKWDGDSTAFPLGLIPPLTMPVCTPGTLTASNGATPGAWKGSEAWFYSVLFENDRGELSMFTVPRPEGSAWSGYEGFGYVQVDAANPAKYYTAMIYSGIADGPPGTRWKHLLRSTKADTASTAGGAMQPAIADMGFIARIPQGQTSYTDAEGNDFAVEADPRILEMWKTGGLVWPERAKSIGRFDGHVTLANLRPNPYALIVAPWANGVVNGAIDSPALYGATSYFVSVQPASRPEQKLVVLRSVVGGVATDKTIDATGLTLRALTDKINADANVTTSTIAGCEFHPGWDYIDAKVPAAALVSIGDLIANSAFSPNTRVIGVDPDFTSWIYISNRPTRESYGGAENVLFVHDVAGTSRTWAAQVVPGAVAEEPCESLLSTYVDVTSSATWETGATVVPVGPGLGHVSRHITPGMLVYSASGAWPQGAVVIASAYDQITISAPALANDSGGGVPLDLVFAYDTGDTALALAPGFVRAFGNAFPVVLPWSKQYLDRFDDSPQDSTFSAASPGYAQDGANTWMVRNRQGGPDAFGPIMGVADLGAQEVQIYAKGRMRLYNPRTGLTHADADYTKVTTSWTRGAISPYAICAGNGWALLLTREGFYVTDGGQGETCISTDIFDPSGMPGEQGELEYAIGACIAATEGGTDDFKVSAQVIGSVIRVRYHSSAAAEYPDREIRYDFSAGIARNGLAEVLKPDGSAYPWSPPLTLRASCSAVIAQADGLLHHYAAVDSNTGATDGCLVEIDHGTKDDGALVTPMGYPGTLIDRDLSKFQPLRIGVVTRKSGTGTFVGFAQDAEVPIEAQAFDDVPLATSADRDYSREVVAVPANARLANSAVAMRIGDDGTGPCPEVSRVILYGEPFDPIYKKEGA